MTVTGRIRDAREDDLHAITGIYNEAVIAGGSSADLTPRTLEQRRSWIESHSPRDLYPVLVAEDESGNVVAFGSLSRFHSRAGYDGVVELSYYVASSKRHQGYATALVDRLVEVARVRGHRIAVALIFTTNTASIALARAHGFHRFGLLPHAARTAVTADFLDMSYWCREL
jgi:L-amino acid N-acyltransferase YncA